MSFGKKNSNGILASKEQKYNQKNVKLYLLGYICATQPLYTIFPFFPTVKELMIMEIFLLCAKKGVRFFKIIIPTYRKVIVNF